VRVVVATQANLEDLCEAGILRRARFVHRIYVSVCSCPRPCDEAPRGFSRDHRHFARQVPLKRMEERKQIFADEASAELRKYGWPGNVERTAANVVERLILLAGRKRHDRRCCYPSYLGFLPRVLHPPQEAPEVQTGPLAETHRALKGSELGGSRGPPPPPQL